MSEMWTTTMCAGPAAALGASVWSWDEPRPEPAHACLRAAQSALRQGAYDAALGWFDHAVALAPDLPLAHVGRAVALLQLRREQEAADALGAAYEASAGPGETDLLLARLYAICGERGAALRQLGEALTAAPLLADLARADPAFRGMRDHPQFLQVLGDL